MAYGNVFRHQINKLAVETGLNLLSTRTVSWLTLRVESSPDRSELELAATLLAHQQSHTNCGKCLSTCTIQTGSYVNSNKCSLFKLPERGSVK